MSGVVWGSIKEAMKNHVRTVLPRDVHSLECFLVTVIPIQVQVKQHLENHQAENGGRVITTSNLGALMKLENG
jgi:hypothetical protein